MNSILKAGVIFGFCLFLSGASATCWAGTLYSIQVAASTDKTTAEETSEQMNRMGHHAFVRLETIPGKGQWHRVYVEKFESKAQADKEAAMLRSLGLLDDCHVKAMQDEPDARIPRHPSHPKKERVVSNRLHFLHFGSFKEKANAEREVLRIEKKGQKAFYVEETFGGNTWFRTYIGEFANVQEARTAGSRMKEQGVISYFKVIGFDKGDHLAAKKK